MLSTILPILICFNKNISIPKKIFIIFLGLILVYPLIFFTGAILTLEPAESLMGTVNHGKYIILQHLGFYMCIGFYLIFMFVTTIFTFVKKEILHTKAYKIGSFAALIVNFSAYYIYVIIRYGTHLTFYTNNMFLQIFYIAAYMLLVVTSYKKLKPQPKGEPT